VGRAILPAAGFQPALEFGHLPPEFCWADVAQPLMTAAIALLRSRRAKPGWSAVKRPPTSVTWTVS